MPTYEYACRDCGHTFEIVQSMWDEPLTMCPECGGSLRKVFAPPAISFKGSGFYATDHGKRAKKPSEDKVPAAKDGGAETSSKDGSSATKDSTTTKDSSTRKEPAAS